MKIYLVTRWGNPKDGPRGADTNFLVFATWPEEAGVLADMHLRDCPAHNGPIVQNYCACIKELGDVEVTAPCVIRGPWVANAILAILLRCDPMPLWHRLQSDGPWTRQ
jgi:hypothetical protein